MNEPTRDDVMDAERALIGDLLIAPKRVRDAVKHVTPDDFADTTLGQVFGLIAGMVSSGADVTPITVEAEIRRRAAEDTFGSTLWPDHRRMVDLATSGLGVGIEGHARVIRDASIARQAVQIARRIAADALNGADPSTLAARAIQAFTALRDGARRDGFAMLTLREVFDAVNDEYDWLIPGLLERGDRVVLTGAEGGGKTTWLRQLAILASVGIHPLKVTPIRPVRVCYVDVENTARQWKRKSYGIARAAQRIAGIDPLDRLRLECTGRLNLTNDVDVAKVHQVLDDHDPEILVIGPLYKLVPFAITNDNDAAPLIAALDSVRDRGVALLMEAHAGHGRGVDGTRDLRPRGSAALLGWPEFGLGIAPDPDDASLSRVVRWRGDRDERDWPEALRRGGPLPWMDDAMATQDVLRVRSMVSRGVEREVA